MSYKQKVCHRRLGPPTSPVALDGTRKEDLPSCLGPNCMMFCAALNNPHDGTCADLVLALSLNQLVGLKAREVTQLEGEPNNGG